MAISYSMSGLYDKITGANNAYVYPNQVKQYMRSADTDVQDMQEDLESFRKRVRNLQRYSESSYSKSSLKRRFEALTDTYNELKEKSEDVEDNAALSKEFTKLDDLIKENAKALRKIGIKYTDKGELNFDEDDFDEAKRSDIEALVVGHDSFIRKTARILRGVEKSAEEAEYAVSEVWVNPVKRYSAEAVSAANQATIIEKSLTAMQKYAAKLEEGTIASDDLTAMQAYSKQFVDAYNALLGESEVKSDYISDMKKRTKEKETYLKEIGMTIQADDTLVLAGLTDDEMTVASYTDAYTALFGKAATYANLMKTYAKVVFQTVLDTSSLGVSIDQSV